MKRLSVFGFVAPFARRTSAVAVAIGMVGVASAITLQIEIKNNTTMDVDDIHLLIGGTGNSITNRVVVNPGNGVINASGGNEFDASFDPLPSMANFIGRFDVNPGDIDLVSGYWTVNHVKVADITFPPGKIKANGSSGGDVVYFGPVPEPASLAALAVGLVALSRRRRA